MPSNLQPSSQGGEIAGGYKKKPYKVAAFTLAIRLEEPKSPFMTSDIKKYINLRDSLIQEKTRLENRLREINSALGQGAGVGSPSQGGAAGKAVSVRRGRRGPRTGLSLRDAVLQVTGKGPLNKEQILDAIKALGYRFSTNNPLNSLGVILYGKNPKFRNEGGRFSPINTAIANREAVTPKRARKTRRKLSPEARERIAAAQRARWAKTRKKSGA